MSRPTRLFRFAAALSAVLLYTVGGAVAQPVNVTATAEIGFLRALSHDIQIGRDSYRFDYVSEGGQELLLPYYRFEMATVLSARHELAFLYQPLTLNTQTRVDNPGGIQIDDVTFGHDTPLELKYGFDFYRATYRYRLADTATWQVALGLALQLRNASIVFDGYDAGGNELRAITQDLGPVPVVSFAARRSLAGGAAFVEGTLDGFYAPVRYLNLRDVDVIGWLYDASLRIGVPTGERSEAYLSARFLGGGADGTASERTLWTQSRSDPRYTWNNLNLAVLSLGVRLR